MNTELFIAKRLFSSEDAKQSYSHRIVRLAVIGITLGMAVMILAIAISTGFQQEIENKVNGFASHLQLVGLNFDSSVKKNDDLFEDIGKMNGVRHIQSFATKLGMMKSGDENQGIVIKGIDNNFDWNFFEKYKVEGNKIVFDSLTNDVWISEKLSEMMRLRVNDRFRVYFLNEGERFPRVRQFRISAIYNTGMDEFDKSIILADLRHVQRLNDWSEDEISGYEIFVDDKENIPKVEIEVHEQIIPIRDQLLHLVNIYNKYPQIFDWLGLLDMNVWIILLLLAIVAGFNMISGLLVIILERTTMIGALRAMGASHVSIRKIFLYLSMFMVGKGLLWGNLLGVGLCLIQAHFGVVHLDPTSYYLSTVPILLNVKVLILLNIGALFITMLMLIGPSFVVSRISPELTIKAD